MKPLRIFLSALWLACCCLSLPAQVAPEWTADYAVNYPGSIQENDMATDKNGNVYITGYIRDTAYAVNVVTLKYNASGQFQWIRYCDTVGYYSKIAVDDSGNVYVSGHTTSVLLTRKYNTHGVLQWVRPYASNRPSTWAFDIVADDLGNVYTTGFSNGNRLTTLKYDASGSLLWAALDSAVNGLTNSYITLDGHKNVYITCRGDTVGYAGTCNTIKYNSAGIKQWGRMYTSNFNPGVSGPADLKYDPLGFVYLLAMSTNDNNGNGDYVVVKYDTLGNRLWALPYSFTSYYDVPKSMAVDKTGNVYVTGDIYPTGGSADSIATIKISSSGVFKWKKMYSFGFGNLDEASAIALDSAGYIYVTGQSSDNSNRENFVTIKYDSLGHEMWIGRYKNSLYSSDVARSVSVDKFGNVYVCGTTIDASTSQPNSSGILTIKYANTVGIQELPGEGGAASVYPNPFETSFTIRFNKGLNDAELALHDAFGKEALKISHVCDEAITVQRPGLTEGIYFFRLVEKDVVIAKGKIIAQ